MVTHVARIASLQLCHHKLDCILITEQFLNLADGILQLSGSVLIMSVIDYSIATTGWDDMTGDLLAIHSADYKVTVGLNQKHPRCVISVSAQRN